MDDEHLRSCRRMFARDGAFDSADGVYSAGLLCTENHMGVYSFCGVSGFCGLDGCLPGFLADNQHSYDDGILHYPEKSSCEIIASTNHLHK